MGAPSFIIFLMLFSTCAANMAVPAPTSTPTGKCPNEAAFEELVNKFDVSMTKLEISMNASVDKLKTELTEMTAKLLITGKFISLRFILMTEKRLKQPAVTNYDVGPI